jgi:hypothetical protein
MQKQWYEAALTLAMLGCSGVTDTAGQAQGGTTVDAGSPTATGGMPTVRYGVIVTSGATSTGGRTSIDTGTPRQTGGTPTDMYGILPTGGRAGMGGGVVAYYGPLLQGGSS